MELQVFGSLNGWRYFQKLLELFPESFGELAHDIQTQPEMWREWSVSMGASLPAGWADKKEEEQEKNSLGNFQQLMFLRSFPPDKLHGGVEHYIRQELGERFLTRPVFDLAAVLTEYSSPGKPLLFLTIAQGFDALSLVRSLYSRLPEDQKSIDVVEADASASADHLEGILRNAQASGSWLLISNCHLSSGAMKRVELWLRHGERDLHPNFRLFLTTATAAESVQDGTMTLPVQLLRRSIKVNTEQPRHLKSNLTALFRHHLDDNMLRFSAPSAAPGRGKSGPAGQATASLGQRQFRAVAYALTFFHVAALERRKFGKIGWNLEYSFNEAELVLCIQMLGNVLSKHANQQQATVPWSTLRYMVAEIIYGRHIGDAFDRRVVAVFTEEYLTDFLFDAFQGFSFYAGEAFDYRVLDCGTTQEFLGGWTTVLRQSLVLVTGMRSNLELNLFLEKIEEMPSINPPDVAGLHPNVALQYSEQVVRDTCQSLCRLQIKGGRKTTEDWEVESQQSLFSRRTK